MRFVNLLSISWTRAESNQVTPTYLAPSLIYCCHAHKINGCLWHGVIGLHIHVMPYARECEDFGCLVDMLSCQPSKTHIGLTLNWVGALSQVVSKSPPSQLSSSCKISLQRISRRVPILLTSPIVVDVSCLLLDHICVWGDRSNGVVIRYVVHDRLLFIYSIVRSECEHWHV